MSAKPVLYSFRRCPFAMRARLAIASSGMTCALREVVLKDKPAEMLKASPKGTVPVLVLDEGRVIEESIDVMRHALGTDDPEGWLAGDGEEGRALVAETDGPFKHHLDRYKYASRYEGADAEEHRAEGLAFLRRLEARLAAQPFLMGERFTLADAAILPFIRQFMIADEIWFKDQPLPYLHVWLQDFLASPRFARVMKNYPQWKTGDEEPVFPPEE